MYRTTLPKGHWVVDATADVYSLNTKKAVFVELRLDMHWNIRTDTTEVLVGAKNSQTGTGSSARLMARAAGPLLEETQIDLECIARGPDIVVKGVRFTAWRIGQLRVETRL